MSGYHYPPPHGQPPPSYQYPPQPPQSWATAPTPPSRLPWRGAALVGCLVSAVLGLGTCSTLALVGLGFVGSSPAAVCRRLRTAGAVENCHDGRSGLLNSRAEEVVAFTAKGGASGQVMSFAKRSDYDTALLGYRAAALIWGSVYGSPSALVIVQVGPGATANAKSEIASIVRGL